MPISKNTRAYLDELKTAGYDPAILASMEKEFDSKPDAEKVNDRSILSQKSFSEYRSNKDNEITQLKSKVSELSALHDQKESGALLGQPELLKAANDRINDLEKILIDEEGYDPEQVKNLSFKERQEIEKVLNQPSKKVDEKVIENEKKYINEDQLRTFGANLAYGGVAMATKIAKYANKAGRLGIEIDDDKFDSFPTALQKGLETGKNEEQVADEHFGFSIKQAEKTRAEFDAKLVEARSEGAREALKEAGVSIRKSSTRRSIHPVLDRKPISSMITKTDDGKVDPENLPRNKAGDPEYFRLRPSSEFERRENHVESASRRYAQLSEIMDDDGVPLAATA